MVQTPAALSRFTNLANVGSRIQRARCQRACPLLCPFTGPVNWGQAAVGSDGVPSRPSPAAAPDALLAPTPSRQHAHLGIWLPLSLAQSASVLCCCGQLWRSRLREAGHFFAASCIRICQRAATCSIVASPPVRELIPIVPSAVTERPSFSTIFSAQMGSHESPCLRRSRRH